MPLCRHITGLLACLLAALLVGCSPADSDTPPTVPPKSLPEHTQAHVGVSTKPQEITGLLREPGKQPAPPVLATTVKLIIEASLATGSIDLEALQEGGELVIPPLQLSADLFQVPLRAVLSELARKLDAKVSITDDVPDQLISLQLNRVSVEEALKQLLREANYVLIYKESTTPIKQNQHAGKVLAAGIAEIRVFPKSIAGEMPHKTDSLKTLEPTDLAVQLEEWRKQALTAEKPEDRLTALEQFLEHADPAEHNTLLIAVLEDKEPEIRKFSLNSMGDSANPSFEPISKAALNDEDPHVRTSALDVLVSQFGEDASAVLEQALTDPDAIVQQNAKNNLEMAQRVKAMLHHQPK